MDMYIKIPEITVKLAMTLIDFYSLEYRALIFDIY